MRLRNKKLDGIEDEELRFAIECSREEEPYPDVFTEDYGLDLHFEDEPEWFAKKKDPCEIELHITSYRGISCGAVHFYGKIHIHHLDVVTIENGKEVYHGGYYGKHRDSLSKEMKAAYDSDYTIEVVRVVTEQMIEEDEDRWKEYIPGLTTTDAFDTVSEVEKTAKRIIKARVPWFNIKDLKVNHDYYDVDVRRYK